MESMARAMAVYPLNDPRWWEGRTLTGKMAKACFQLYSLYGCLDEGNFNPEDLFHLNPNLREIFAGQLARNIKKALKGKKRGLPDWVLAPSLFTKRVAEKMGVKWTTYPCLAGNSFEEISEGETYLSLYDFMESTEKCKWIAGSTKRAIQDYVGVRPLGIVGVCINAKPKNVRGIEVISLINGS